METKRNINKGLAISRKYNATNIPPDDTLKIINFFGAAIKLQPDNIQANYSAALEDYNFVIENHKKYKWAYYYRAMTKGKVGDIVGSNDDYTAALQLDKKLSCCYFGRAFNKYFHLKDSSACSDFQKAYDFGDRNEKNYYKSWICKQN
jgi:lipoprotein NlpI